MANLSAVDCALHSSAGSSGGRAHSTRASSFDSFETSFTSLTSLTVQPVSSVEGSGAPVLDSPELGRGIMSGDWGFARAGE